MARLPSSATLTALVVAGGASLHQGAAVHASAWVFRLAVGAGLLAGAAELQPARGAHVRASVAAAVVAAGWGLWRAPHLFAGLEGAAGLVLTASAFGTLACLPRRWRAGWLFAGVGTACVHAAWAVGQRAAGVTTRGYGGFFNPNDLAALAAPAALLAAGVVAQRGGRGRARRLVAGAGAVTLAAGVWASGSRSGVLGLAVGTLGICLEHGPSRRRAAGRGRRGRVGPAAVLAVVVVVSAAVAALVQRARNDAADPYAYGRLAIWRSGLAALRDAPWGVGFGGVGEALAARGVSMPGTVRYPALAHNAHGEWLQAALELGVASPLVVAAPLALAIALARHRRWEQLGVWLSFAVPAATGAPLHQPPVALLAASWAAWAWPTAGRAWASATGGDRIKMDATGALGGAPGFGGSIATYAGYRRDGLWRRLLRARAGTARVRGGTRAARRRRDRGTRPARGTAASRARLALGLALAAMLVATLPNAVAQACAAQAESLLRRGRPAEALAWVQRACVAAPWEVGHLVHRADVAVRTAAVADGGVAAYRALTTAFPRRPEPWQRLAAALQAQANGPGDHREAAHAWDRAARLRPTVALLWVHAGEAFARAGETSRAKDAFVMALGREPHCARAHFGRAALAHRGGLDKARTRAARRALRAHALAPGPSAYAREVLALSDAAVTTAQSWAGAGWADAPEEVDDPDDEAHAQNAGPT